jgi:hypothetical protein
MLDAKDLFWPTDLILGGQPDVTWLSIRSPGVAAELEVDLRPVASANFLQG